MSRALISVASVAVAVAGVIALLLVLQSRDTSTINASTQAQATVGTLEPDQGDAHHAPPPGFHYATDPPTSGPHLPAKISANTGTLTRDQLLHALELGDVVLVYGNAAYGPRLAALRDDVAGNDPALIGAGQAILLDRQPGTQGVVALAWRRLLRVGGATDGRLREFAQAWLGHGASP